MIVSNNQILSDAVNHYSCRKNSRPLHNIQYIVIHYTASGLMRPTINYLITPEVKASAHLIIGRDGTVAQLVPFNIQAWHAGNSHYKGLNYLNAYSIGIELINRGKLICLSNTFYDAYAHIVPKEDVFTYTDKNRKTTYWQRYTVPQLIALQQVCELLLNEYQQINDIIGHSDITSRKLDPGPAFPMQEFKLLL